MVAVGDLPAPLQDRELTDPQEQKSDARASVAETENAVIISCLLVIAFERVRKRFENLLLNRSKSLFLYGSFISMCSSFCVVSSQATVKIQALFRGYWQRVSPALGDTLVLEHIGNPAAYFRYINF